LKITTENRTEKEMEEMENEISKQAKENTEESA